MKPFARPALHTLPAWLLNAAILAIVPGLAQAQLPLQIELLQPTDPGGTVFYAARESAHAAGQPDRFKIKGDVWIGNTGSSDLEMTGFTLSFPGSGLPSSAGVPLKGTTLPAGGTGRLVLYYDLDVELPTPLPATMSVSVEFVDTTETFDFSTPLALYENDTPAGSHIFPMDAADMASGESWRYWNRHVDQGSTGRDRYAYDFDVVRWHDGAYIGVDLDGNGQPLDGSENEHYLAFGDPLYAAADGLVVLCTRGVADNEPGVIGNAGGNELWIQHAGEVIRYSHIREGTMPAELCPVADGQSRNVQAQDITVNAGQFIGQIGNTGQSSGPHLHISVHSRPDPSQPLDASFDFADARPLNFHNVRIASDPASIQNLGASPVFRAAHGRIIPSQTLIVPNPCGLDFPDDVYLEHSRHGIPLDCYQDVFNLVTGKGYRPVFVDGYNVGGDVFFNATFRPAGPANYSRFGLTAADYQQVFNDRTAEGFRLHQLDVYLQNDQPRYAAIFEQRPGPGWAGFHGLDDAEFGDALDQLADDGAVPVNISAVWANGRPYWAGLFEWVPAVGWTIETVTQGQYQDTFDANVDAGRIPTHVNGSVLDGNTFITGVWVDPVGGSTAAVHGLSATDYQSAYDDNLAASRWTRAVTGYDDGTASTRFAAVWRGNPDTGLLATPALVTNNPDATFEFEADNPFTTFACSLDSAAWGSCASPLDLFGLAEGTHEFEVRAIDREGIEDPTPASYSWLVDLTPPEVTITAPLPGTKTVHGELKPEAVATTTVIGWADFVIDATDNLSGIASVVFEVNGQAVPGVMVDGDTWSMTFQPDQNGEQLYTVSATVTDGATNVTSVSMDIIGVKTGKKMK